MKDRIIGCFVAGIIAAITVIMPVAVKSATGIVIPLGVNSSLWFWLVLVSALLGLGFLYSKSNVWLKILAVYCLINCFTSKAPFISFTVYVLFAICLCFYLLCRNLKDYTPIFRTIQSLFFLNIILTVSQSLGQDRLLNFGLETPVFIGIIGNKMQMASFIICLAPFLIAHKRLNIIPLLLMAWISKSLGATLSLGAGICFYLFFVIQRRLLKWTVIAVMAILVGWYCFKDPAITDIRFKHGRWPVWKRTISLANDNALMGWGIGTYQAIFPMLSMDIAGGVTSKWKFQHTEGNWLAWRKAHNCYLQLLFEIGRLGIGLFLMMIMSLFWNFIRSVKTRENIVCTSGCVAILMNMLVHFPDRMIQSVPILICWLAFYETVIKRSVRHGSN